MRTRGSKYWAWADPMLHSRCHEEVCSDGNIIDVQVRLSCTGLTQLFIGVYSPSGDALFEDAYYARPGESMSTALLGVLREPAASPPKALPLRSFSPSRGRFYVLYICDLFSL